MNSRFTMDGSLELENNLAQLCDAVLLGIQKIVTASALEGIVLGGGYGRGQGGVLKTDFGDEPYNDLEFYIFVRGNLFLANRRHRAVLSALGQQLSAEAGLHVEFKLDSLDKLRRGGVTMYSYDLVNGHKIIFGGENLFQQCEHHLAANKIPDGEVTRLLFNRCSGLLLARDLLRQPTLTNEQVDFIHRNLAKAQLAFGDAVLTSCGLYHWNCLERHQLLLELKPAQFELPLDEIQRHHAHGVEFKLHPCRKKPSPAELKSLFIELHQLGQQLWLWTESRRLKRNFASARDYALAGVSKCPATAPWRNGLLTLRTFGLRALFASGLFRYPRERLFNTLCLLLWDDHALDEPSMALRLQNLVRAPTARRPDLMLAYRGLWENYG